MKVEIWSDVVCPFCYIGKRRFEEALQGFEGREEVQVEWKSYQLNPGLEPVPGQSIHEYLAQHKGISPEHALQMNRQVEQMAAESGLSYQLDRCVVANTADAHRLIQYAKTLGKSDEMEEALFKAYFTDGKNLNLHEILLETAVSAGLPREDAARVLASNEFADQVELDAYEASQLGVRGVPFFVFDRKYGISGAQPLEVFERTFRQTLEAAAAGK